MHCRLGISPSWIFSLLRTLGNLVCPSSYDLGENLRLVLTSVTEGEDKPLKYPTIFNSADVAVLTKMDLSHAVDFDEPTAIANIQAVRPGMQVLRVSAKTGLGMKEFIDFLGLRRAVPREMNVSYVVCSRRNPVDILSGSAVHVYTRAVSLANSGNVFFRCPGGEFLFCSVGGLSHWLPG